MVIVLHIGNLDLKDIGDLLQSQLNNGFDLAETTKRETATPRDKGVVPSCLTLNSELRERNPSIFYSSKCGRELWRRRNKVVKGRQYCTCAVSCSRIVHNNSRFKGGTLHRH